MFYAGNDDQRNGKQILSHNEALGTASVDSGDSSSTQQSIGGSVTAFSEVTSKTEQGSDAAEDMIAPIHESMTITKEGMSISPLKKHLFYVNCIMI